MAPDVVTVIPRAPYVVRVVFADGEVRDVDILYDPSLKPASGRGPRVSVLVPSS